MSILTRLFLTHLARSENLEESRLIEIWQQWEQNLYQQQESLLTQCCPLETVVATYLKPKSKPRVRKQKASDEFEEPASKKKSSSMTSLVSEPSDEVEIYKSSLNKLTCVQLKTMLKEQNLTCPKNKIDMIKLLVKANAKLQQGAACFYLDPILNKHVHSETALVIDNVTMMIIGKKLLSGEIAKLGQAEVDLCNENNFKWDPSAIECDNSTFEQETLQFDEESDIEETDDEMAKAD
jgi:hypothetical protein